MYYALCASMRITFWLAITVYFFFILISMIQIQVMPLAGTFQDNEEYITVGSNPVPLHRNHMKNHSIPFSTRCKPSIGRHPQLTSRSDHLPCTPNTTVSECKKFRRRALVDLGSAQSSGDDRGESSCSSSFKYNSLSLNEALPVTSYTHRHDESLRHSHFWRAKATSAYRPHNHHINLNYAAAGPKFKPYDICFDGKRNSALIGDTLHEKDNESCIELQEGGAKERILRPGMVLLKHYITHDEQVLDHCLLHYECYYYSL